MKNRNILLIVFLLILSLFGSVFATTQSANDALDGKTLSDVIYNISQVIINNESQIVQLSIDSDISTDYTVSFITDVYATLHNITCDGGNCTLFGQYNHNSKTIYVLPESINTYYNGSTEEEILNKIYNTYVHELSHYYQYESRSFMSDMISSLGMDVTYISDTLYTLNNYVDYQGLNLTGVPNIINDTIDFPDALTTYNTNERAREIIVKITAVCFQEKSSYQYYWDMIEIKNYTVCNNYNFPLYVDNNIAYDTKLFIEAYFEQYLGINLYLQLEEASDTAVEGIGLISTLVGEISNFISEWLLPMTIAF